MKNESNIAGGGGAGWGVASTVEVKTCNHSGPRRCDLAAAAAIKLNPIADFPTEAC